jgi:GTPase involved in cell partitioning and DNA repair
MIVDEIKIKVTAGSGGKGMVNFSKTRKTLGPTGGSGGNGGNVLIKGVADLAALKTYRFKKEYNAKLVEPGFSYNSGENKEWETVESLRKLIKEHLYPNFEF